MKNKNEMLKAAFEEAAKAELEKLPEENKVIRPYSDNFRNKMEALFMEEKAEVKKRRLRFGRVAVIAAALVAVLCTFTASAYIIGDGIWKLVNFTPDPEDYHKTEVTVEGAYDNDEIFVEKVVDYIGEPITVSYSVDTGETWGDWPDQGIMVFVDGVKQSFSAKTADEEWKNIDMLYLQNENGTKKEYEFTFQPNIGKKGDEMYVSVVAVYDPYVSFYEQCDTKHKQLMPMHFDDDGDGMCDRCSKAFSDVAFSGPSSLTVKSEGMAKLVMKKDAPSQTLIAEDFSGLKVDELDKKIYESYEYEDSYENKLNDYDTMQSLAAVLYKSVRSSYVSEWGVDGHVTRIKTKAKENDDFTINLHGATGKYRVSLYINSEMQKVFDGSYYADVDVVHGQQAELTVNIDTSELPEGDNYFYVVYEKLDGEADIFRHVENSHIYTVEVK